MQLIDFSASKRKITPPTLCSAPTYGSGFKMNFWMFNVLLLAWCGSLVLAEFPGESKPAFEKFAIRKICKLNRNDAISFSFCATQAADIN